VVVVPSTLNAISIFLMVLLMMFAWRLLAAKLAERGSPFGEAMAVIG
jgi:hypothetical protein